MTLKSSSVTRRTPTPTRAFVISVLNALVTRIGTIGIGIALARLLGPEQFGTYAIAFVALMAVLSFNELGVSLAIVRWPGDPKEIAATVTTISTACSLLLFAISYAAAPYFTAAMGNEQATDVVRVLAACIVLNGLVSTPAALLQRNFRQGQRMVIDQVNVWLGAGASLLLVILGMGAMSLAVGRVAASLVSGILFLIYSPLPYRFGFSPSSARQLLLFGLPLAGASMVVFAVGYLDQLTVGKMLGPVALGFYVLALNMAGWPSSLVSQPLRSVAPAAFARLQDAPAQMRTVMASVVGVMGSAMMPVSAVLAAGAVPVVTLLYGEEWSPAAVVLAWLAPVAVFKVLHELIYDFLVVLKKSVSILGVQVLSLLVLFPALLFGANIAGLTGLAAAPLVVAAAVTTPLYLKALAGAGMPLGALLLPLGAPLAISVAAGAVTFLVASSIADPLLAVGACLVVGLPAIAASIVLRLGDIKLLRRITHGQEVPA
ncbi:oligosaccharide flippase family protein [Paenarthrobacter sp. NPDC089322]|uniref:oligosaccharide flippase family protein n=1 Tax=Paenarthrobacter sp. NPDC089322 TaxID=3155065 RepID=UPI003441B04E